MIKNFSKSALVIIVLLISINTIQAQWKYNSLSNIKDDVIISYDVVYERELTEKEKKSSSFIREIITTFNKNKLINRIFYNSIKTQRYSLYDYKLKKYYNCSVRGESKSAIEYNFKEPKQDVVKQENMEKDILGFSSDISITMMHGKPYEIYSTKDLGLRYVKSYNLEGFLLEYPGHSKSLGSYRVVAKKISHYKIPKSVYSLEGFKIQTAAEYKKAREESKERSSERSNKYKVIADRLMDKEAPSYKTRSINKKKISSKDMLGKVVVLNFWFTTCPPCKAEIPNLNELKEKYKGKDVEFIAFALDEEYKLDKFLKSKKFKYDIVAESRWLTGKFEIQAYPTNVIIDKEGKVQFYEVGYKSNIVEKMSYKIDKLLEE